MFLGFEENAVLHLLVGSLMEQTYECVFLIDTKTNTARKYCFWENLEKKKTAEIVKIENADDWLADYFKQNYVGDDLDSIKSEIKVSSMMEKLEISRESGFSYSMRESGQIRRKRVAYRYLLTDVPIICLTRQDITTIYEEEKRTSELIDYSVDVAQNAIRVKEEFLYHVSQEIREPLFGLNGMLELFWEECKQNGWKSDYLLKAKKSLANVNEMMQNMLHMAVIEQGKVELAKRPIILKSFLDEIAESLAPLAKERNQQVIFEVDAPKMRVIIGDPEYWRQMVVAIMDNSLRYGHENGYAKCKITSQRLDDKEVLATIVFTDNGRGMNKQQVARAFEDFYAPEEDSNRGLGLPLAKQVVRMSGGTISLESEENVGTTVTIKMPVKGASVAEEAFETKIDHMVRSIDEINFSGKKALLVSKNEISLEVMKLRLTKLGLAVETCMDGLMAWERLIQSSENEFQIMFTDINLPSYSGLALTRELRMQERSDLSDLTIVAVTSHVFREERIEALESGMDYHLPFPIDDVTLKEILVRELFDLTPQKEYEVRGFRIVK